MEESLHPADADGSQQPEPIGGGFQMRSEQPSGDLWLDAPFAVPAWQPRPPSSPSRPDFPGSGLEWQQRWYEIVERVSAGAGISYRLQPWNDSHILRRAAVITAEACTQLATEHRERQMRLQRSETLAYGFFLAALLPAATQKRLEVDYNYAAARSTTISAGILISVNIALLFFAFAVSQGMSFGSLQRVADTVALFAPLYLYLLIESAIRFWCGIATGEPMGSLLVALPWQLIHRDTSPKPANERSRRPADAWQSARDDVQRLPPAEDGRQRLQVTSDLPKDHWTANVEAIRYRGETYFLAERSQVTGTDGERHGFLLEEPIGERLFRFMHDYHPEEVREVYRERKRRSVAMWVETFALLWGFTSPDLQQQLSDSYDYDPWKQSQRSIIAGMMLGGAFLINAFWAGQGLFAALGLIFLIEAISRWLRLGQGQLSGSMFGPLLAPWVRPSLRWRPNETSQQTAAIRFEEAWQKEQEELQRTAAGEDSA